MPPSNERTTLRRDEVQAKGQAKGSPNGVKAPLVRRVDMGVTIGYLLPIIRKGSIWTL